MHLNTSHPYSFLPSLARVIGLHEAILAGRLQALLQEATDDPRFVFLDEKRWLVATYRSLRNREFPFYSLDTVRLSMRNLNRLGILISEQKPYGQAENSWYWHHTINDAVLVDYSNGVLSASRQLSRFRIRKENLSSFTLRRSEYPYQSRLTDDYITSHQEQNYYPTKHTNLEEQE